eukprot:4204719-Amphidinium_carterae.1
MIDVARSWGCEGHCWHYVAGLGLGCQRLTHRNIARDDGVMNRHFKLCAGHNLASSNKQQRRHQILRHSRVLTQHCPRINHDAENGGSAADT